MSQKKSAPPLRSPSIDIRLVDLSMEIDKLKSLYDQYFAGVLKMEPKTEHKALANFLHSIKPAEMKTTAARFRFQNLQLRYIQLNTQWSKYLKQIEEGVFKRDLFLLRKKEQERQNHRKSPTKNTSPLEGAQKNSHAEKIYEKLKTLADPTKLPAKEKFVENLSLKIEAHRQKNPDKKVEIKLLRSKTGKIEIKIQSS